MSKNQQNSDGTWGATHVTDEGIETRPLTDEEILRLWREGKLRVVVQETPKKEG